LLRKSLYLFIYLFVYLYSGLVNLLFFLLFPLFVFLLIVLYNYASQNKMLVEAIGFFNLPNPSSRTMALRSTQPLTEMSTRNLSGGKGRPVRKADNLTAICEPIV
jgi:hypothetical protein